MAYPLQSLQFNTSEDPFPENLSLVIHPIVFSFKVLQSFLVLFLVVLFCFHFLICSLLQSSILLGFKHLYITDLILGSSSYHPAPLLSSQPSLRTPTCAPVWRARCWPSTAAPLARRRPRARRWASRGGGRWRRRCWLVGWGTASLWANVGRKQNKTKQAMDQLGE